MVTINRIYHQLLDVAARYVLVFGGRRSGKSVAISQLLVMLACQHKRKILIVRKFATSLRFSVWPRMLHAVDESVGLRRCTVRLVDKEIILPNGSMFLFAGLDDVEKLKSVEDLTDVWVEETTEIAEDDLNVIDAGISADVTPRPKIYMSFNPIPATPGSPFWLRRRFLDRVPHKLGEMAVQGNVAILKTWFRNNHFCPPETVTLLNSYETANPDLFEMWAKGNWVSLQNAILDPKRIHIVDRLPEESRLISFGLDFGFVDPSACIEVRTMDGNLYVKERVYASGLTNAELSDALDESGVRKGIDFVIADSAEPKTIRTLREDGWMISPCEKGADFKRAAAQNLRSLDIYVEAQSTNLLRELHTWSWKQNKAGDTLPLPADGDDHCCDALCYATFRAKGVIRMEDITGAASNIDPLQQNTIIDTQIPTLGVVNA